MTSAGGALGLLQQLHPLFFAQPLSSFGGSSTVMTELKEEKSQQLQLGVAVAVSEGILWLKQTTHGAVCSVACSIQQAVSPCSDACLLACFVAATCAGQSNKAGP